ncbi:MAG: undecaprenyl-diphosphate phosphatase [Myxococcales bacterium]|nr:undecaprenyl-diphosphate phosphatase [Myxococcales bacterium]
MLEPGTLSVGLAALLGALQGIAEFLPISSSGHLSLAQRWLAIPADAGGHSFNIVVHAGTLLAVLVHYGRDLLGLARASLTTPGEPRARARRMIAAILLATAPLGLVLLPGLEDMIIAVEGAPRRIGGCLLVTAALLAATQARGRDGAPDVAPGPLQALGIGALQLFAVLPGVSRSGSTIAAGLALGLPRAAAARFSFLISIPAILGATLKEGLDLLQAAPGSLAITPAAYLVGFAVSFVVGLVSLKALLSILGRVGLWPFVPYLVLVGGLAIALG